MGCPSTWMVQAPQRAIPHPYLVPVSPMLSRNTQSSGVSGSTSIVSALPLTFKVNRMDRFPPVRTARSFASRGSYRDTLCRIGSPTPRYIEWYYYEKGRSRHAEL